MNKKKLLVLFFSFFCLINSYSQTLQWRSLPNAPFQSSSSRFEDVFFVNPNTGWVVNISGKIFKTTNGGNSWDTVFSAVSGSFRSIGFFDPQNGVLGTLHPDSNLVLYRTTNGGSEFSAVSNLPSPRILGTCGINIVNENVAYACGKWNTPARMIKTTDKGNTWSSLIIDTLLAKSLVDCYFWTPDSGLAVGGSNPNFNGNAVVIKTTDGGNSWKQVHRTARLSEYCWKISFVNRNLGYVSIQGVSSYYLRTTNGGLNWEDKSFRSYTQQGIGFVNENTGWIGGWGGPNYETTDAGISWHLAGWGSIVNRFRFLNDTLAYAVGNRIYKYSRETVGIQISSSQIPEGYFLYQNFPNPFNPATKIKFDIIPEARRELQDVKLVIYDALGKEVTTLVNENLAAGSYEVEFDGSNFSSGVYFYYLVIRSGNVLAENFSEVKRMILLK